MKIFLNRRQWYINSLFIEYLCCYCKCSRIKDEKIWLNLAFNRKYVFQIRILLMALKTIAHPLQWYIFCDHRHYCFVCVAPSPLPWSSRNWRKIMPATFQRKIVPTCFITSPMLISQLKKNNACYFPKENSTTPPPSMNITLISGSQSKSVLVHTLETHRFHPTYIGIIK